MSIRAMYKRCIHCCRSFPYNPSVGDLGLRCPHCGKPQIISFPIPFPRP